MVTEFDWGLGVMSKMVTKYYKGAENGDWIAHSKGAENGDWIAHSESVRERALSCLPFPRSKKAGGNR